MRLAEGFAGTGDAAPDRQTGALFVSSNFSSAVCLTETGHERLALLKRR